MAEGYAVSDLDELFRQLDADTINLRLMWRDIIITREPQIIQSVLATNFNDFGKGRLLKVRFVTCMIETMRATRFSVLNSAFGLLGNGIFNNDGDEWRAHRALTRPFFSEWS